MGVIECQPLQGNSLLPILEGGEREEPAFFLSGWKENFRMFRQKEWKIVKLNNEDWELYNLKEDPTEITNLAAEMPEKVKELEEAYLATKEDFKRAAMAE
jgi:arylsulfatase